MFFFSFCRQVALVTEHVDMNFTVNHAFPRRHVEGVTSARGGHLGGVEEVTLSPASLSAATVEVPTRTVHHAAML